MADDMLKMNNATQQKLKMQAQEMGISMKDATLKYDSKDGYYLDGWKKHREQGLQKAVDKGVKEGTLTERASARRRKIDKAIDG